MEYRNAKYINTEHTRIDCEINHPIYGWIPYTLDPNDTDMTIDNNYLLSIMTNIEPYTPPTDLEVYEFQADNVRRIRNRKLMTEIDPYSTNIFRMNDLTETQKNELSTYRHHLLDISKQEGFPTNVNWGVKPDFIK